MDLNFPKDYQPRYASASNIKFDDYEIGGRLKELRKDLANAFVNMNQVEYGKKYDCIYTARYYLCRVYDKDGKTKYVLYDRGVPMYIELIEYMQMVDKMFVKANSGKMYLKNAVCEYFWAKTLIFDNPGFSIKYQMICLQDILRFVFTGRRR